MVAMAIKTYTEQLEEVQTAITAILGGAQSHSINGRQATFADLGTLFEMQKQLMPLAKAESNSTDTYRARPVEFG